MSWVLYDFLPGLCRTASDCCILSFGEMNDLPATVSASGGGGDLALIRSKLGGLVPFLVH